MFCEVWHFLLDLIYFSIIFILFDIFLFFTRICLHLAQNIIFSVNKFLKTSAYICYARMRYYKLNVELTEADGSIVAISAGALVESCKKEKFLKGHTLKDSWMKKW